jgi:hypothetical protein
LQNNVTNSDEPDISIDKEELLRFKNRLYIPNSTKIKLTILDDVHKKPYYGHLGYQKKITTLRKLFYWPNMKGETIEYLARCQDYLRLRLNTSIQLAYYSHYQYQNGNGRPSHWTL